MKRVVSIALTACVLVSSFAVMAGAEIRIGILAQRGEEKALQEYGALADYLTRNLGDKVTAVPVRFSQFMDWCRANTGSFIVTNPWFFVRAKALWGAYPLATIKFQGAGPTMGGVILARRDSGIAAIEDMQGKSLICPKFSSPGGWLFQKGEMVRQGVVPERDLRLITETEAESHDEVVLSVRDRKADVGTVRSGLLEAMARENKIALSDFAVINETRHEGFQHKCSTPLYPDWPFAALQDVPLETATRMKKALLAIPPGHPALVQARNVERFVEALDYGPVEELCRFLKVKPFSRSSDQSGK
ncbi:MAG: phosphate/phosphite/phosphonate ABC transporter substrate-binding protein [Thermodesulfobacteriota bacterium]